MGRLSSLYIAAVLLACCLQCQAWNITPSRLREQVITLAVKSEGLAVPVVDPPTRIAGYFKLDRTKAAEMFYFYFQARNSAADAPVVLWMTGGPGCSSELAVLYENGPYTLDKAGQNLIETKYGWDVTNHMIFVDQPIGTGFSYSDDDADTVYNEKGVGDDMLDFLQHFFSAHPDLANKPFFVTGESYAGHYVPAVSHRVWLSNKNKEGPRINLQGLAVGNGLTSPSIQFNAYGDYALANGLIGQMTRTWMSFLFPVCRIANDWCDKTNWDILCAIGNQFCMMTQFGPILSANPDINVYDITKKCDGRLCYDFTAADKFLNSAATRKALGVGDRQWVSCSPDVYANFAGDWLHRFDDILPEMMADGIRVMIYAGDLDLICNYLGNRRWVDSLDWSGSEGWAQTDDKEWVVQGLSAGLAKEYGPLTFLQVYKAGHMVPMDQGLNSLVMITSWTRNRSLTAHEDSVFSNTGATTQQAASAITDRVAQMFNRLRQYCSSPECIKTKGDAAMMVTKAKEAVQARVGKQKRHAQVLVSQLLGKVMKAGEATQQAATNMAAAARRLRSAKA